jgi:hypothetical protein
MNGNFGDYLKFNKMITPVVIQVLFWLLMVAVVVAALAALYGHAVGQAIAIIVLGPIFVRIYAEVLLVIFKINDAVQTIAQKLTQPGPSA